MKNKFAIMLIALTMILSFVVIPFDSADVFANSSLSDKIQDIQDEQGKVKDEKKETQNTLAQNKQNQKSVEAQIRDLDYQVQKISTNVQKKQRAIGSTKAEIKKLKKDIQDTQERISQRNQLLKDRLVALQENGGKINYFSVLLGAESFGDFLSRVNAVSTIMNADKDIMNEQKADEKRLEKNKTSVETKLTSLNKDVASLKQYSRELEQKQATKDTALAELKAEGKEIQDQLVSLAEKERILRSQEIAAKAELEAWKKQQEENQNNGGGGNLPPVTSGDFMRPAQGPVSSEFGPRSGRYHYGIDIAGAGVANKPIVAAASGTVIESYYSNSYGNVVFVSHNIRGQVFTTVYAHLSSRMVSQGQRVNKGQQLGVMGNTGMSFGTHLHFEIHEGFWNFSKTNAVNPRKYVNF